MTIPPLCYTGMSGCAVENGGCDHQCINSYNGNYYCRCRPGYKLMSDGKSCTGMCAATFLRLSLLKKLLVVESS